MGNSVAAREYGDVYQGMVFWKYANQMLSGSDIKNIGYEYDKVKSFDDIVVTYQNEQRFRDGYIDTDYIQVKFHMKQSNEFTMDNLLDPAFINADTNSFLQNVVNAYRSDGVNYSRSRFIIYSPWQIKAGDILNKLISNVNKSFDLNVLRKGKTVRSEMGALCKKLCEKLDVTIDELFDILKQVCIYDGKESIVNLKELLNREFDHNGLQPWTDSRDTFPYCDLVRSWNRNGINVVNADYIRAACKKERLVKLSKDIAAIAVKSFSRQTEWLDDWASDILDLTGILNRRELCPGQSWKDIFQSIEQFVGNKLNHTTEYHVALETSLSVSFTAGRILNPKSGIKVVPVQKTMDGHANWRRDDINGVEYSGVRVSNQVLCDGANDMVLSIGVTHDIDGDVRTFIDSSGLKIGLYKSFVLDGIGTDAVKDGTHAWQLAKQIHSEVSKRSGILKKGKMHIFIAGPNSLMFYLGMQSMMYGKIQIYEFDVNGTHENIYYPTITFPQEGEF